MQIMFTDAERAFADSPEGALALVQERLKHERAEAHRGANATPWTDAMQANAVRRLATQHARETVATAAVLADAARVEPELRRQMEESRRMASHRISNAWKPN